MTDVPQHIIQRGNNRQASFFAEGDYRFYLECVRAAARKYECSIHAYVLMTNHVHMLASARHPGEGLSRMMQHVGRRFVHYINQAYGRTGTLWEGRYRASMVDTEQYFLRCCRYIELNPVRAGMVGEPGAYPWSSYRHHAHGVPDLLVSAHEQYARLGRTPAERHCAYRAMFRTALHADALNEIRDTVNRGWPLGSERFKDEIARTLGCAVRPPKRGRPPSSNAKPPDQRDLLDRWKK